MTTVLDAISLTRTFRMQAASAGPSIAPLMTHGAISASWAWTRDQRLSFPTAKRSVHDQPLCLKCPATQPGEVRVCPIFVNEYKVLGHSGDSRRAIVCPIVALSSCLGATASGSNRRLFLCVKPRRFGNLATAECWTVILSASASASRNSKRAISGP